MYRGGMSHDRVIYILAAMHNQDRDVPREMMGGHRTRETSADHV